LDDFFPNPVSSFRFTEFNHYFHQFDKVGILTTGNALLVVNEKKKIGEFIAEYNQAFPLRNVAAFDKHKKPFARVCYMVFLNNAYNFLPYVEAHALDFVFCLYPGGGFNLDTPETNEKLKAVCSSPYFKGVIVTQKNASNYLLDNHFCTEDKICYIFGGILAIHQYAIASEKPHFGINKPTLDICFMANKYMKGGIDKGFDVFAGVAKAFDTEGSLIRFHVVGPYSNEDIEGKIPSNIQFHGVKLTAELNPFFEAMDIILSPNRAGVLQRGAFDGFPTGSCVEAALKGVAMFITDPLQLNTVYENGKHIEIIDPSVKSIVSKIKGYLNNPEALQTLALNGQKHTRYLFSNDIQLSERVAFLNEKIGNQQNSKKLKAKKVLETVISGLLG
jgi:glycosyltransferase involved in cell wall biosynthesis